MKLKTAAMGLLLTTLLSSLSAAEFVVDKAHSHVGFSVKHLMITNVKGDFGKYDATIDFDTDKMEFKTLKAVIDVDSIDTGIEKRDNHLRSADFFDAANHPEMTFVMKKYENSKMTGDLTIRGTTKEVVLDTEIGGYATFMGTKKIGFALTGEINRKDFGLMWNKVIESGGVAVSDTVKIIVEIEANEK